MAVVAPIPIASIRTAVATNPGDYHSSRVANFRSGKKGGMLDSSHGR
jgi:hypothetical protein